MKLKGITSALASAGIVALACGAGTAQAGAMANAMVNMDNFVILKATSSTGAGATQVLATDLTSLSFTSSMDYAASLTGFAPVAVTDSGSTGPGIDQPAACIGGGCVAPLTTDNAFGQKPGLPILGQGNYAAVDQREIGSPVVGLTGYPQDFANIANSAYVSLETGSGAASTTSNNNLQASWQFNAGFTGFMAFDFDVDVYLQAALDALENSPTFATAAYNISFTLSCLDTVDPTSCGLFGLTSVSFNPDIFSPGGGLDGPHTVSRNAPLASGTEEKFDTGGFVSVTSPWIPVVIGKSMQLSARIEVLADLQRVAGVPEPGVLALLGLGLLGLGTTLRRKAA